MPLYKSVLKDAIVEMEVERSRFIGHVRPVDSKEEADLFIADVKHNHKTATHNVPAFVIGDNFQLQWASDDGEPQGTSGAPIVNMLVKEGITNVAVVITRYFGGIKLGTGGLVRAYTGCAKMALERAGICFVDEVILSDIKIGYSEFHRLESLMDKDDTFRIINKEYAEIVKMTIEYTQENAEKAKEMISNYSKGAYTMENTRIELRNIPIL
ncbi:MAG: YigZ family protein [Peptostreptococcaceae bacterium]|nr:YigZ family protein [Peptostreptococcaceae bacterium]MDY5739880.1 YigZ family protein [Anaerovoracaceae bacterium]